MEVRVYAAGGTGANITRSLLNFTGAEMAAGAKILPVFLDSSDSNIRDLKGRVEHYLLDSVDGSGGDRAANLELIAQATPEILLTYPPKDLNIIVHSGGGGTGNVFGNCLARELLKRGEKVVIYAAGSALSKQETTNSLNMLLSYEKLCRHKPVVMTYYENTAEVSESENNRNILRDIGLMTVLFSGQNHGLDSADLGNLLNYPKVTSFESRLTMLTAYSGNVALPKGEVAVAMVSLIGDESHGVPVLDVEYRTKGTIENMEDIGIMQRMIPIHFVLTQGHFGPIVERLQERKAYYEQASHALKPKALVVDAEDDEIVI